METTKRELFIIQLAQISKKAKKAFMKNSLSDIAQFENFEKFLSNPVSFDNYLHY